MLPQQPITMRPLPRPPSCTWAVPGSKSLTNRALVLAALAEGTTDLHGVLLSDDTRHMREGLQHLGIAIEELGPDHWRVHGGCSRLQAPADPLFVGNSGTTVRFLTALATLIDGQVSLQGDEHMAKRPLRDLVQALRQMGVEIACPSGCPPLTIFGQRLRGGRVRMPGQRSSQYFSALLMAGACADKDVTIDIDGPLVSRPYVGMTIAAIKSFGGQAELADDHMRVKATGLTPCTYHIEPDASAASYPLMAAAATGGRIRIPGLGPDALQGDVAFVEVCRMLGVDVSFDGNGIVADGGAVQTGSKEAEDIDAGAVAVATATLTGVDVDMHHISDTVMSLAAVAPLADGPTHIRNIANIRIKETDRLTALVNELRRLGQDVDEGQDWLRIEPRPITPAVIRCYADHRMAMSFAILGLAVDGVTIEDPACVAKTYPGFWDDLAAIYQSVDAPVPWS